MLENSLKRNQLKPGNIIFSDHYESRLTWIVFWNRRYKVTSQVYKGGTIFYNSASRKIIVHHKVSFTSEETIVSKIDFEREAMGAGVPVESYSTNNDIYNSKYFNRDLHGKVQIIRHILVGCHHHNGVAENAIIMEFSYF